MIPPDRWIQVKTLFAAAVERQPDQRAAFLQTECRDDDALRREVEALLAADAEADSFIETPAAVISLSHGPGESTATANLTTLRPGDALGPYEIVEFVGAGGMGEVYKARDRRLDRHIAIKVLAGHRTPAAAERFDDEARAASALNHPNIVTIYDVGRTQSGDAAMAFIVMEFVEGRTLRALLENGTLPLGELLDLSIQIAGALAAAHERGLVHRDLKPENIMITREGRVKVLDFGLARVDRPSADQPTVAIRAARVTQAGAIVGTIAYMSPEQARGRAVDFRSDLFALGSVLYEMATGIHPFRRPTTNETIAAILTADPTPIGELTPELPAPLQWIVSRCLARKAEERYTSTEDLGRELAIVRQHLEQHQSEALGVRSAHNLPAPRTSLVGREMELAAIQELLGRRGVRLVSLTGPGGCGKTRLAIQAGMVSLERFPGGVHFVPLASATDGGMVAAAIAQGLSIQAAADRELVGYLKEYARSAPRRATLLVLDNFEQALCATPLIAELLDAWPTLTILVTSRAALCLYGEHEFRVLPLGLPEPGRPVSARELARVPAVDLFLQRSQAANADFALTGENIRAAAEICARLDGLPLAIELAAARTKVLPPTAMLPQLRSRLTLLARGPRDVPDRQRTLRDTMDWSHGLLTVDEQELFRRLSVFAGGCTLDAAEAVCNVTADPEIDVLGGLESLVDQSLVWRSDPSKSDARFLMLETIQEYASERLAQSGEEASIRRAHSAYCLILAEEAEVDLASGREQPAWIERLSRERYNFEAALDWLVAAGNAEWGLRLSNALYLYWASQAQAAGRLRVLQFARLPAAAGVPRLRAKALSIAGGLSALQADFASARELDQEALAMYRELENAAGVLLCLNNLAVVYRDQGDFAAAATLFGEIVQLLEKTGERASVARALSNVADVARAQGDFGRARSLHDECLSIFRDAADPAGMAWSLSHQADVAREQGDVRAARELYERALGMFRELKIQPGVARCLEDLGALAREQGATSTAQSLFTQAVAVFHELGEVGDLARALEELSACAVDQGKWDRALRLAAAASGLRNRLGSRLPPPLEANLERTLRVARERLGASAAPVWMEGMAMGAREAVAYVRGDGE